MTEPLQIPEGFRLVREPTATEMLASNVAAAASVMSVAVAHRQNGGELTYAAKVNLKIIRRWAAMLLNGETPQPGDGVSDG